MRSYLGLIPASAKAHRKQNRMTHLCIVLAVFLVTAVFSIAEKGIRMEQVRLAEKHGVLSLSELLGSDMGQTMIGTAGILFVLILIAGVLMISGSINSNVAQRTKFFGMMRCIGMSKRQIIRFVRLESLNWCRTAVPIGLGLGILAAWVLSAVLRFAVGEEFSNMPVRGISITGIVSGIVVGVVTVLLAAGAPARRAARVSPVSAVSGSEEIMKMAGGRVKTRLFKVDTALGVHHAVSAKKNLVLMTGSFALSIVLFLSFSVLIDFVDHLMPQSAAASDLDIASADGSDSIDRGLLEKISSMEGTEHVYGRRSCLDVPAEGNGITVSLGTIDIVSYDDFDLECLAADGVLKRGSDLSEVYGDSNYVLATWDPDCSWKIGDTIEVEGETLEIAGLLNYDPFSGDGLTNGKITLITSSETFTRLTGVTDYPLVMIQTTDDVTDEEIEAIRKVAGDAYIFSDKRDQSTAGTYTAFVLFIYGFLLIITLVTLLSIMNSISMSVTARIRQYGAMRAAGMSGRQLVRMISAEAFTYAAAGCVTGCILGLLISKGLYDFLITAHFRYAVWSLPVLPLVIILLCVLAAAAAAVYGPARKLKRMSVTETIHQL